MHRRDRTRNLTEHGRTLGWQGRDTRPAKRIRSTDRRSTLWPVAVATALTTSVALWTVRPGLPASSHSTCYEVVPEWFDGSSAVAWSSTDREIIFAEMDGRIVVASTSDLVPRRVISWAPSRQSDPGRVVGVSVDAEDRIVVATKQGFLCQVDCQTGRVINRVRLEEPGAVPLTAATVERSLLYVVSKSGRLWQVTTGPLRISPLKPLLPKDTTAIAMLNRSELVGGTADGRLFRATLGSDQISWLPAQNGRIHQVVTIPQKEALLAVVDGGYNTPFWRRTIVVAAKVAPRFELLWSYELKSSPNSPRFKIDVSPNGAWVALPDGVYNVDTGVRKFRWPRAWSPKLPPPGLPNGARPERSVRLGLYVETLVWSNEGDIICVASNSSVKLVRFSDRKVLAAQPTCYAWRWGLEVWHSPTSSFVGLSWGRRNYPAILSVHDVPPPQWWLLDLSGHKPLVRVHDQHVDGVAFQPRNRLAVWEVSEERIDRDSGGSRQPEIRTRLVLSARDAVDGRHLLSSSFVIEGIARHIHVANALDHVLVYWFGRKDGSLHREWLLYDTALRKVTGRLTHDKWLLWRRCLPQAGLEVFEESAPLQPPDGSDHDILVVARLPDLQITHTFPDVSPPYDVHALCADSVTIASAAGRRRRRGPGVVLRTPRGPARLLRRYPSRPFRIEWVTGERLLVSWSDYARQGVILGQLLELNGRAYRQTETSDGRKFYGVFYAVSRGKLIVGLDDRELRAYCGWHGTYLGSFWPLPGGEWAITDRRGRRSLSSARAAKWFVMAPSSGGPRETRKPGGASQCSGARWECPECHTHM